MRRIGTGETDLNESPLEAFVDGCNKSLFLAFREGCEYLDKSNVAGMYDNYECGHPENGFITTFKEQGKGHKTNTGGYPQCSLLACPIFERLKVEPSVTPPIHAQISLGPRLSQEHQLFEIFEEFLTRLEALKPIDA